MARPEGLHIPEIQPKHIRRAEWRPEPFAKLLGEQGLIAQFLDDQLAEVHAAVRRAGAPPIDLDIAKRLTGTAYRAMGYAYRRPLPTVQEEVMDEYFSRVKQKPDPARPEALSTDDVVDIIHVFHDQQRELHGYVTNLLRGNSAQLAAAAMGTAIMYQSVEAQLGVPVVGQG